MKYAVIIDFDGTITQHDVSDEILRKYATGDWISLWKAADQGEITMNECIVGQFSMIEGEPQEIKEYGLEVPMRRGFSEFISYCQEQDLKTTCVSAGLSFIIDAFFERYNIDIPYIAPLSKFNNNRVEVTPVATPEKFIDFKHHHVRKLQDQGYSVIFIGDGGSDTYGMKYADHRITIRGSTINQYCMDNALEHHEITDFSEAIEIITKITR